MKILFDYLYSIRNTDMHSNIDVIRERIKEILDKKIKDEEFSIGTFVLYFPTFRYIFTLGTEKTFGKDYMNENIDSIDEFFKKMHPADMAVHHEKMQPYLHEYVKKIPADRLKDWVFTFDFRIMNEAGEEKCFLGKNMFVLDDNKNIIFIFGRAFDVSAFHTVQAGKVTLTLTHHIGKNVKEFRKIFIHEEGCCLSGRELEILKLLKAGNTSRQISEILFISPNTVNNHRKNMLRKTETKNTMELINFASQKGLI